MSRLPLEDRAELHDLYIRYAYAFDDADLEAWPALFTRDGRFHAPGAEPLVGRDALRSFLAERSTVTPGMRHRIANVLVEKDGDGAVGRAYFLCFRLADDGELRMRNMGRYEDVLARTDEGWCFAERRVVSELPADLVDAPFAFSSAAI